MKAFLWERRPRRDRVSQTTTHRPEGGAPTMPPSLITVPKASLPVQTSPGRINRTSRLLRMMDRLRQGRGAIYDEMNRVLAALHKVDVAKQGLAS